VGSDFEVGEVFPGGILGRDVAQLVTLAHSGSQMHEGTKAIVGAFLATFVACGGGSGGQNATGADGGNVADADGNVADADGNPSTPEAQTTKFCADVVAPFCDALFACCVDPQTLDLYGGSVAACNTKFAASCKTDIGDASFLSPRWARPPWTRTDLPRASRCSAV
jgi:hypothetical protein